MMHALLPTLWGGPVGNTPLRPGELAGVVVLVLAIVVMVRGGFLLKSSSRESRNIGTALVSIGGIAVTAYLVSLMFFYY